MLKNFLLISLRNILKNKGSSYINIVSLTFGIAICLFILHYINYELNYDSEPSENSVYRIETYVYENQEISSIEARTTSSSALYLAEKFDEIENYARLISFSEEGTGLFRKPKGDSTYSSVYIEKVFYAEASIVNLFDLSLTIGDSSNCLTKPNSILLSDETAKQVFQKELDSGESIIGKTLKSPGLGNVVVEYIVTGIFKDRPNNTHIKFDALVAKSMAETKASDNMNTYSYLSFSNASLIPEMLTNGVPYPSSDHKLMLRPINEIHLASGISGNPEAGANKRLLIFSSIIALIILLLASTNHTNNTIFNSVDRAKEIGVRKLLGIKPKQLFMTLMGETFLVNGISMLLSLVIFRIGIQLVQVYSDFPIPSLSQADTSVYVGAILLLLFLSTLLSGTYPAFYLTSLSPIASLKSKYELMSSRQFNSAGRVIKYLLIFQLGISVCFLSGLYIVYSQLEYLKEVDQSPLTVQISGIFPGASGVGGKFTERAYYELNEYQKTNALESYAVSNLYKGEVKTIQYLQFDSINNPIKLSVMGHQSVKKFAPKFLAGRNFYATFGHDEGNAIITKATMHAAGYQHPDSILDQTLISKGSRWRVIGVIDKLSKLEEPEILVTGFRYRTYVDVVLNYPGGKGETLNQFLDKNQYYISKALPFFSLFKRNYQRRDASEKYVMNLFLFLSIMTLIIANMGMLGLASFVTQRRQKEIGIRKVLGAESLHILYVLILDFLKLIVIASLIAIPLVLFASQKWLENYAYRVNMDPIMIILPLLTVLLIALVVVSEKCFKLAVTSPLSSLKQ